ncbi:MAG: nitric oxide reductase transcriptional regulator NorR [Planctomycetota bacterium]
MSDTTHGHLSPELLELLLDVALNLTATFSPAERYERLVSAVRRTLPCDAATLMRRDGEDLVLLASHGLSEAAQAQRFSLREHPRLELIANAEGPTVFPADSELPDPFDGLLEGDLLAHDPVHACYGCPLRIDGELVGVLTADATSPHAFDGIDPQFLATLGALAAATVRTARLLEALEREAQRSGHVAADLMREVRQRGGELLGVSPAMQRLREEIELVARADMTVLVTGETGTGKELVAQAIHGASRRQEAPLIYVNCAALPESIAESELFGHVRGAFTGAHADRAGKFEVAHRGTLFLDEVGELSLRVQALLLRALQQGEVQRVGADVPHRVDVRVLAATNRDLEAEVAAGRFRADLFHRLAVYRIHAPPLRARVEDVGLLAGAFADRVRRRLGSGPVRVNHAAQAALRSASWPGNVRELENVVSRAVLAASARTTRGEVVVVEPQDLSLGGPASPSEPTPRPLEREAAGVPLSEAVEAYKRRRVEAALRRNEGSWAAAARELGMHRGNLYNLAKRLGVEPDA